MYQERRVLLSKQMAQAELRDRMNAIKLSKGEQEVFFRRYDMFERKAFRTMNSFKRSNTNRSVGSHEVQTPIGIQNSFFKVPTKEEISLREELINKPFERNVNQFKIRKTNTIYRSVLKKRLTRVIRDRCKDQGDETASLRKVIGHRTNEVNRGLLTKLTVDKVTDFCEQMRAIMNNDRQQQSEISQEVDHLNLRFEKLSERMRRITDRIERLDARSGFHSIRHGTINHFPSDTFEQTMELSKTGGFSRTGKAERTLPKLK